mgnify:CR=1 FL=1
MDKIIELNAFLDTGNFLATNLKNEPVIVVSKEFIKIDLIVFTKKTDANASVIFSGTPLGYMPWYLCEFQSATVDYQPYPFHQPYLFFDQHSPWSHV